MLAVIASPTSESLAAHITAQPRFDLYRNIHKALRVFMGDALERLGAIDADEPASAAPVLAHVRELLAVLAHHLHIEEQYVLPAIEQRRPGATLGNARDHRGHERELHALREQVDTLERVITSGAADRAADAQRLYLALADFVADNLLHMATEERMMNPILWALFSDEDLGAIEQAILASQSPDESMRTLRWMMPALTPGERARIVLGMRAAFPPAMFEAVRGHISSLLDPENAAKLDAALA